MYCFLSLGSILVNSTSFAATSCLFPLVTATFCLLANLTTLPVSSLTLLFLWHHHFLFHIGLSWRLPVSWLTQRPFLSSYLFIGPRPVLSLLLPVHDCMPSFLSSCLPSDSLVFPVSFPASHSFQSPCWPGHHLSLCLPTTAYCRHADCIHFLSACWLALPAYLPPVSCLFFMQSPVWVSATLTPSLINYH